MPKYVLLVLLLTVLPSCSPGPGRNAAPGAAAERAMIIMEREIIQGLASRNVQANFDRYQTYAIGRMDASAGDTQWSDKTGNCRGNWLDWMIRNQLEAPAAAERFTRRLHQSLSGPAMKLHGAIALAAGKLDVRMPAGREYHVKSPGQAISAVRTCLASAGRAWRAAIAPLTDKQTAQLRKHLYELTTARITGGGASWPDRTLSRRLCDIMESMGRQALLTAAADLAPLADSQLLVHLAGVERSEGLPPLEGTKGELLDLIETPDGNILIGGGGQNTYDLDKLADVAVIIDVAGNDTYLEGTVTASRPVLAIMDLAGDDRYRGSKPGIQGGAVLGVSMLVDFHGNDVYEASDVAQGSCLAGIGILIDWAGEDSYRGLRRAQGSAVGGIGMLIDRAGNDRYHAALYAQGFGGPLGFGLIDDLAGMDHYYAGGLYLDGYGDTRGYAGWSQGMGAGPRGVANGGVGVMLDGGGDDIYECDYFSHGGGYGGLWS